MSNDTCLDMWHLQPERIVSAEKSSAQNTVQGLMKTVSLAPDIAVLHYFEQLRGSPGWRSSPVMINSTHWQQGTKIWYLFTFIIGSMVFAPLIFTSLFQIMSFLSEWDCRIQNQPAVA